MRRGPDRAVLSAHSCCRLGTAPLSPGIPGDRRAEHWGAAPPRAPESHPQLQWVPDPLLLLPLYIKPRHSVVSIFQPAISADAVMEKQGQLLLKPWTGF